MSAVSEVLLRAAEVIDVDGWCQFDFTNGQGQHCLVGAIKSAAHNDPYLVLDAKDAVSSHLGGLSIINWNDSQGRRADEVTALLRATARDLS